MWATQRQVTYPTKNGHSTSADGSNDLHPVNGHYLRHLPAVSAHLQAVLHRYPSSSCLCCVRLNRCHHCRHRGPLCCRRLKQSSFDYQTLRAWLARTAGIQNAQLQHPRARFASLVWLDSCNKVTINFLVYVSIPIDYLPCHLQIYVIVENGQKEVQQYNNKETQKVR